MIREKKMRSRLCVACCRTVRFDDEQYLATTLPAGMDSFIIPCECGHELWFKPKEKKMVNTEAEMNKLVGEPMTLISNTKQDKQIAASSRYSRLTFWGAIVFFSGLGNLIVSKAPAAWCFVTNTLGEFLISISGK